MNNANKIQAEILLNSLKGIEESIKNINNLHQELGEINDKINLEISSLEKQRSKILEQINEFKLNNGITEDSQKLESVNEKYDNNLNTQDEVKQQITELEAKKEVLKTNVFKNMIDKKIESKYQKLEKLQQKEVKLEQRQRVILMKKQNTTNKRNEMLSKRETAMEMTEAKINDNNVLKSDLGDSVKDKVVGKIYDIKGKFYQKQYEYQANIFNTMKEKNVDFKGANVMIVTKKSTNFMRNSMKKISIIKNNIKLAYNNTKEELNQMLQDGNSVNENINANSMSM